MCKIKKMYACLPVDEKKNMLPLELWHNDVIEKKVDELTLSDVLRMIRQKVFLEAAVEKAIIFLKDNPLVGEMYDGELMCKFALMDNKYIEKDKDVLLEIFRKGMQLSSSYEWIDQEEKEEYEDAINFLEDKFK